MIRLSNEFYWLPQRPVPPGFSMLFISDEYLDLSVPENLAKFIFKPPLFWLWWMWV